jgi:translation initiation factor 6
MAIRVQYESSNEVGVFARLTPAYCLLGQGGPEKFYQVFEAELAGKMPVIRCTLGGQRIVGRITTGNSKGLLVPEDTSDQEMDNLRSQLPETVSLAKLPDKLSALGNCIACNDSVALVHTDMDEASIEVIKATLQVETFRATIASMPLCGSYCVITNNGGMVHPRTSQADLEELAALLQLPLTAGTVNRGGELIGAGIVANDTTVFVGSDTTGTEIGVIENIFRVQGCGQFSATLAGMQSTLIQPS